MGNEDLSDFFKESELTDDIFSVLEAFDNPTRFQESVSRFGEFSNDESFEFQNSAYNSPLSAFLESEVEAEAASPNPKRQKLSAASATAASVEDGPARTSSAHITVERNRRKQMNEHISVLRSLMPCFYVKRVCMYVPSSNSN